MHKQVEMWLRLLALHTCAAQHSSRSCRVCVPRRVHVQRCWLKPPWQHSCKLAEQMISPLKLTQHATSAYDQRETSGPHICKSRLVWLRDAVICKTAEAQGDKILISCLSIWDVKLRHNIKAQRCLRLCRKETMQQTSGLPICWFRVHDAQQDVLLLLCICCQAWTFSYSTESTCLSAEAHLNLALLHQQHTVYFQLPVCCTRLHITDQLIPWEACDPRQQLCRDVSRGSHMNSIHPPAEATNACRNSAWWVQQTALRL